MAPAAEVWHYQPLHAHGLSLIEPARHPPGFACWLLLYTCGACGVPDCGATWVQVIHGRHTIRWIRFLERPGKRGFANLGPYRFSRLQYEAAFAKLWNHLAAQGCRQTDVHRPEK